MPQHRTAASAALAALALAALAGCAPMPPQYDVAVANCLSAEKGGEDVTESMSDLLDTVYENTFTVAEDGDSLEIDTVNSMGVMLMGASIQCVLGELDAPSGLWARMGQATGFSGVQSGEWDGHTASWTYHPDNGLDIVITRD